MSQTFKQWSSASGITPTNAQDIVRNPDSSEVLEYAGAVVQFFTKRVTKTNPPVWAFVASQSLPGKSPELLMVFKVHEGFAPNIGEMQPTELLRLFADRFGRTVRIGRNSAKKLYLGETVPLTDAEVRSQFIGIDPPKNSETIVMQSLVKLSQAGTPLGAVCALALAADLTAYQTYLWDQRNN